MGKKFYMFIEATSLHSKIHILDELYNNVEIFTKKYLDEVLRLQFDEELKKTDNEEEEREIIAQSMEHRERIANESRDVLSQYMIVATFSFYEKSLKKILKLAQESIYKNLTDEEIKNCFKENQAKAGKWRLMQC